MDGFVDEGSAGTAEQRGQRQQSPPGGIARQQPNRQEYELKQLNGEKKMASARFVLIMNLAIEQNNALPIRFFSMAVTERVGVSPR